MRGMVLQGPVCKLGKPAPDAYLWTRKIDRMKKAQRTTPTSPLVEAVVLGMQEVKAKDIVHLDLRGVPGAVCDHFLICHGESSTQVEAIARSIERFTVQRLREKPWHVEGRENAGWVLLDYVDVVAHVFLRSMREHYALDQLWADAARNTYDNVA